MRDLRQDKRSLALKASLMFLLGTSQLGSQSLFGDEAQPDPIDSSRVIAPIKDWSNEEATTVNFIRGGSALSEAESLNLKALYQKATHQGALARITVLAWSDKDIIKDEAKANEAQLLLAEKRADVVKELLAGLSHRPVQALHMPEDGDRLASSSASGAVKSVFGANGEQEALTRLVRDKGGFGKALVIFERDAKLGNKAAGL